MAAHRTTGPGRGGETHRVSAKVSWPGTQASWPSLFPGTSSGSHALARGFRFDQLGFDVAPLTDTLTNLLINLLTNLLTNIGADLALAFF